MMTDNVANKKMVAGFLFAGPTVLLVRKLRPSWQEGLLNGVGGVIEPSETPPEAMVREFVEETRCPLDVPWRLFATEVEPFGSYVHFFRADLDPLNRRYAWPTVNDVGENLAWYHPEDIHRHRCLGNLSWLLPLARDPRQLDPVVVTARGDIRERASW